MLRFLCQGCSFWKQRCVPMNDGISADHRGHLEATGHPTSSAGERSGGPVALRGQVSSTDPVRVQGVLGRGRKGPSRCGVDSG